MLDLLRIKGTQMDTILHYVASSIILHFCDRDMKSTEKYLLDALFQPLLMCVRTTGSVKILKSLKIYNSLDMCGVIYL